MPRAMARQPRNPLLAALRSSGCDRNSCWECDEFVDGGTLARLGAGWWAFMADRHFGNVHGCVETRVGGFCDALAVSAQPANSRLRVIEVKATPDFAAAKPQLRKGVQFALSISEL